MEIETEQNALDELRAGFSTVGEIAHGHGFLTLPDKVAFIKLDAVEGGANAFNPETDTVATLDPATECIRLDVKLIFKGIEGLEVES